ncbi:MAG: hypothetical protein AB9835_10240 [Eubacteriales bacterium]
MFPISMVYNTETGETEFKYSEIPDKVVADFFVGAYEKELINKSNEKLDEIIFNKIKNNGYKT